MEQCGDGMGGKVWDSFFKIHILLSLLLDWVGNLGWETMVETRENQHSQ
jgi:hypothetical protein